MRALRLVQSTPLERPYIVCYDEPRCIPYGRDWDFRYHDTREQAEAFAATKTLRGQPAKAVPT